MKLEDVLVLDQTIYAHRAEGKEKETLQQHTDLCEAYYETMVKEKKLERIFSKFFREYMGTAGVVCSKETEAFFVKILKGAITFHDAGKINPVFQREKMKREGQMPDALPCLKGARHSFFSAIIYIDYCYHLLGQMSAGKAEKRKLKGLVIANAYMIAKHHGDLDDIKDFIGEFAPGGQAFETVTFLREKAFPWHQGLLFFTEQNVELVSTVWSGVVQKLGRKQGICLNAYMRLLYSLLTSVDYYATTEYMNGFAVTSFGEISQKEIISEVYESCPRIKGIRTYETDCYGKNDVAASCEDMNILRNELFLDVERCWNEHRLDSIFFLEAPTGSGKSNVAMNLSFQMLKGDLDRIYYVYPFNTLVEQNLESLKDIFGAKEEVFSKITVVNSITPIAKESGKHDTMEECDAEYYQKILLDRQFLNYPMVITTHVSLFETLFGNKRESVFGFLQMANSVIVLDEIQSYKNKIWSEIILFLKTFADLLNMKIIVMSATLPDLEYLTGEKNQVVRLLKQREKYFSHPKFRERVSVSYEMLEKKTDLDALYQHLCVHSDKGQKILIEFIKKTSAYEFYELLCERGLAGMELRLLTGDDNSLDRLRILNEIKGNENRGIVLIATQVVEAGADIDMDLGYKDISKLDSEEQFLGRINRSCRRNGMVYFFNLDAAEKIYKGDIRINPEFTLKEKPMQTILTDKNFEAYYGPVLEVLKRNWNESVDTDGLEAFFDNCVCRGNFKGISSRMKLIEDNEWKMSVFLARRLELPDGSVLDGWECWEEYKALLQNQSMDYAEKQVKLYGIRSRINHFIYEITKNTDLVYSDRIGELYGIQNGESYFTNGTLDRKKLECAGGRFIE